MHRRYPVPVRIETLDVTTGRRAPFTTLQTASATVSGLLNLIVGTIVYNYARNRSQLYVISGLK